MSIDTDFDNLLGDLSSAIADLESISAPTSRAPVSTLPTNPVLVDRARVPSESYRAAPYGASGGSLNRIPQPERKPIQGYDVERSLKDQDFDLDDLLTDLSSFDPMKTVGAKAPPPTNREPAIPPWQQQHQAPPPSQPQPPPQQQYHPSPQQQYHPSPQQHHPTPAHLAQNGASPSPQQSPHHQPHTSPSESFSSKRSSNVPDGRPDIPSPASSHSSHPEPEVEIVREGSLIGASEKISKESVDQRLNQRAAELRNDETLTEDEREAKLKEEKMRIALEKLKVASKKTVAVKVFNNDGSNKTVVLEEGMSSAVACYLLVNKNHFEESPNWALIERLGDVGLERPLEDHECVVDVYTHWARDTNNQFLFKLMDDKYEIFEDPTKYFPSLLTSTLIGKDKRHRADKARKILVQEYFSSALRVPELEGYLHLKDGYKSKWKKVYFILRASGLYHTIKGTKKTSKNLQLLCYFSDCDLYRGVNFKKMLKAPTEFCLALRPKPSQLQMVPGAKDIKVVCADSDEQFLSWYAGIRLATHGKQLYDNYYKANVKQFKLEDAEGEGSHIEKRMHSISGYRLEKHLDRKREAYQKEQEARETQQQILRGPPVDHEDGSDAHSSEGSRTPEPSPQLPKVAPKPAAKPARNRGPGQSPDIPHQMNEQRPNPPQYPAPATQPPPPPQESYRGHGPVPVSSPTPPPGSSSPLLQSLTQFPWYHGAIPREEAIRRLEQMGCRDGTFLVRDSSSVANSYVLTMFAKSVPKNFQILLYEGPGQQVVYRIDDGPAFPAVDEMLQHYRHNSDRLPCKLTDYCPRPPTRMTEC